jgi:heat shock protein HtpX
MAKATFYEEAASNRRRSVVLLIITFIGLYAFVNLIALALGAYSRTIASTCDAYGNCTSSTAFWWNPLALAVTAAVIAAYLLIAYRSATKAALSITKARPADGAQYAQLRNVVEGVSIAAGIPMPAVYVIDDPAPNAFATGMHPDRAAVVVTSGLLQQMSRRELEGVMAHEVSHIRNRDSSFMTLVVLTVGAIVVLSDVLLRIGLYAAIFSGGGRGRGRGRNDNGDAMALVFLAIGMIGLIIAVPFAIFLKAAVSRRREALADASAVELTRNPTGIRSALEKLEADTTVVKAHSTATAHLWIESPLDRRSKAGLSAAVGGLFDSHPPLATRIATLRRFEGLDPDSRGPIDPYPDPASAPGRERPRGGSDPLPPPRSGDWYVPPAN